MAGSDYNGSSYSDGWNPDEEESKRKKRIILLIILLILLAALIAFAAIKYMTPANDENWYDDAVQFGYYNGKTQQEIIDDLNAKVKEGEMILSINSVIAFDDGTSEGDARIENVSVNHVDQKVTITLDDTGETIYESKAIAPGQYIQKIRLSRDLSPGTYEATARFQGYDRDTHEEKGALAGAVKIIVRG